ncbi:MAG: hybrid sensor histidine kinase/response regulator [Myxococcales bacterium]|nr:hybrid sensor histidine kinase/response regulator [Myxococcales bacterium]
MTSENRRVLLVDDDPEVLATYSEILQGRKRRRSAFSESELHLHFADSGRSALDLVKQQYRNGQSFACGVFDMRMPEMDGLETIREIRKIDRSILCTVCTAYTDRNIDEIDSLFEDHEKDQWDYIQKPVSTFELIQKVRCFVSSWNRRCREEQHQSRMIRLVTQLSRIISTQPGSVEVAIDRMIDAVRDITQASQGILLEGHPENRTVLRSWSQEHAKEGWINELLQAKQDPSTLYFPLPDSTPPRTLVLTGIDQTGHGFHDALGLLLKNASELIFLNKQLFDVNHSLNVQYEALANARAQVIQATKLAAAGRLTTNISHEVGSPLRAIQLETETIIDHLNCNNQQSSDNISTEIISKSATQVQYEAQNIKNIVCQVRDLALFNSERSQVFIWSEVIDKAVASLEHHPGSSRVHVEVTENFPPSYGDTSQMIHALTSLLLNVLETPKKDVREDIYIRGKRPLNGDKLVRIEILDNYPHFIDHQDPNYLSPFCLAMVEEIIELHSGQLVVQSEPNKGTLISMEFPAAELVDDLTGPIPVYPNVLVLRANHIRATRAMSALHRAGATPTIVHSPEEVVEHLRNSSIDIITMDSETRHGPMKSILHIVEQQVSLLPPVLVFGHGMHTISHRTNSSSRVFGEIAEPFDVNALKSLLDQTACQFRTRNLSMPAVKNS